MLNQGKSYINHITSDQIQTSVRKAFEVTADFSRETEVDALVLCIPTPFNKYREPDLGYVIYTVDSAIHYIQKGHVISF